MMDKLRRILFILIIIPAGIFTLLLVHKTKAAEKGTGENGIYGNDERVPYLTAGRDDSCISFSHESGAYSELTLEVVLTSPEEYTIAYTTDGSFPVKDNDSGRSRVAVTLERGETRYLTAHRDLMLMPEYEQEGFYEDSSLPSGTVLTVALVDSEGRMSKPVSKVYFLGEDFEKKYPDCIVISLVADPDGLLDYETGILATGAVYDEWKLTDEAETSIDADRLYKAESNSTQHGRAWERPVLFQLYDSGNRPALECGAGIRVRGGISRRTVQKSFNIYFRKAYGNSTLEYELFPGTFSHKSITLKIGGNTMDRLKYKEIVLYELLDNRNYPKLHMRPAVLFLNGEYWGPYLLQEKISSYQLANRFGVDADQIVVIKDAAVEVGKESDIELYEELMSYAKRDLTDHDTYREFCSVMDVNSMADCFAAHIYIGVDDWWPTANNMLWRTRDNSFNRGRWQYILYDTDFSSGAYGMKGTSEETNHFLIAIERHPLFAAALKNEDFFKLFLSTIKEIGAKCFAPDRVLQEMYEQQIVWEPLMKNYYIRYQNVPNKMDLEADRMIKFFNNRYDIILPMIEAWGEAEFGKTGE